MANPHNTGEFQGISSPAIGIPLSKVYRLADRVNRWLKKSSSIADSKIISIGNITAGGTGKTPAVIYLASALKSQGYRLAILCRGYGGSKMKEGAILSDGEKIFLSPQEAGDEPCLLAENLSGIPIAIGKNRLAMGNLLKEKYRVNLFILDDGFQHYPLKRDFDIVLVDAVNLFGNGHLLPYGPLREPPQALLRANAVILTKTNLLSKEKLFDVKNYVETVSNTKDVFLAEHAPESFIRIPHFSAPKAQKIKIEKLNLIRQEEVWALSGIANHRSFEQTLYQLGAISVKNISFRDHYQYNEKDIESILARVSPFDFIITTEKDWMRLAAYSESFKHLRNFYYLKIQFKVKNERQLLQKIAERIQ